MSLHQGDVLCLGLVLLYSEAFSPKKRRQISD